RGRINLAIESTPDRNTNAHLAFSNAVQAVGRDEAREWQLWYAEEVRAGTRIWHEQYLSSLRLVKANGAWIKEGNPQKVADDYFDSGQFAEDWEWVQSRLSDEK